MTYPQPDANLYVIAGQDNFRLNTLLQSPGDIYESAQSGHALALGPTSDVANVRVAYFDDQVNGFMNQLVITQNRSWTSRIDARNEAGYVPTGRPGKILLWCDDEYLPNFFPFQFNSGGGDEMTLRVIPRLDVVEYFTPQDSLVPARNDFTYLIQNIAPLAANPAKSWFSIPYWGRRYAAIQVANAGTVSTITVTVLGVNYAGNVSVVVDSGNIAADAADTFFVDDATDGMFDALFVSIFDTNNASPPTAVAINIRCSDTPP